MVRGTSAIPERIRWTVELLGVRPTDRVLEIGCGPGHAISLVCARLTRGAITAIDRSALQVTRARERNRECVASGRARIEHVSLGDLEVGRRRFDKIFAINVNAFWTAPPAAIASVRRVQKRGGLTYLVYEPPTAARLRALRDALPRLLSENRFDIEDVRVATFRRGHGLCIIGRPA